MGQDLTTLEALIVAEVRRFTAENGFAPTLEEIGRAVGLRSKASVFDYVSKLVDAGVLARRPNLSRTISIVEEDTE